MAGLLGRWANAGAKSALYAQMKECEGVLGSGEVVSANDYINRIKAVTDGHRVSDLLDTFQKQGGKNEIVHEFATFLGRVVSHSPSEVSVPMAEFLARDSVAQRVA